MSNFTNSKTNFFSPIVHGMWRLDSWNYTTSELLCFVQQCIDLGINVFDHADIYGNYTCEEIFGQAIKSEPQLRHKIKLVTKCGIKLTGSKFPDRKIKTYDYSYNHIVNSAENSLNNLNIKHIDLLLLHRPSPFFNPDEVAEAFNKLKSDGKVLKFGVSNFTPGQMEMLASRLDFRLFTNQIEISPLVTSAFSDGTIEYLQKERIQPMAWSPLAGGKLKSGSAVYTELNAIANEMGNYSPQQIAFAFLLNHPANIIPIVGSGKIERVKQAVDSLNIKLTNEQWFRIYNASTGCELP